MPHYASTCLSINLSALFVKHSNLEEKKTNLSFDSQRTIRRSYLLHRPNAKRRKIKAKKTWISCKFYYYDLPCTFYANNCDGLNIITLVPINQRRKFTKNLFIYFFLTVCFQHLAHLAASIEACIVSISFYRTLRRRICQNYVTKTMSERLYCEHVMRCCMKIFTPHSNFAFIRKFWNLREFSKVFSKKNNVMY